MTTYSIDDAHSNQITTGLQGYDAARKTAERMANERGEAVYLYADGGEYEEVAPAAKGDLVLCESPDGWSLHAPGSTDEDIASGAAPYLVSGTGEPTEADYARAWDVLRKRTRS